jgi:hypothetical protein
MFAFAVVRNADGKKGSVVTDASLAQGGAHVVVMWDDDFTFSCESVRDITGNPVNLPAEKPTLVDFPGGKGDEDRTH